MRIGKDLVAAAATPMVLGILAQGDSYGYAIIQRVHELSDGELEWRDGMLYPLLHRLENAGDVDAFWMESDTGRPRKMYRLSKRGAGTLSTLRKQWAVITAALERAWEYVGTAGVGVRLRGA